MLKEIAAVNCGGRLFRALQLRLSVYSRTSWWQTMEVIPTGSQELRTEVAILLADEHFKRSEKQVSLLNFLLEKQLAGHKEEVTEYQLAVDVFHRQPHKWIPEDSIVRVQIHELRKRLRDYYVGEGRSRPFRVELPKRSYCLELIPVSNSHRQTEDFESGPPEAGGETTRHDRHPDKPQLRWTSPVVFGVLAASALLNAWFLSASLRGGAPSAGWNDGYAELFGPKTHETLLCLGNPEVRIVRRPNNPPPLISPNEYQLLPPAMVEFLGLQKPQMNRSVYLHTTRDEYTGTGDAVCAFRLGLLLERGGFSTRLTQARFLTWDRALQANLIVLGHPRNASLWTRTNIGPRLSALTSSEEIQFKNREYARSYDSQTGRVTSDYGVISKETTPSGFTRLVITGNMSIGTYGVGEFLSDPKKMSEVFRKLRSATAEHALPRNFAVLFKIKVDDNLPTEVSVVDYQFDAPLFK